MKKDFNISNCIIIKQMIFHKSNHYVKYSQYHWKDSFLLYYYFFFNYLFCMNLQKLIVSREKETLNRKRNRWISSLGSKERGTKYRWMSFDPIEEDPVRFLRFLSNLPRIRRNKSSEDGITRSGIHTLLYDESYFLF